MRPTHLTNTARRAWYVARRMARTKKIRKKPVRQSTPASRALVSARREARLRLDHTAEVLGVHPRTVSRWEFGESKPSPEEWSRLVAFFARYVPERAARLAAAAGVSLPGPPVRAVDVQLIEGAILRAADRLDVSPRRVRAALREITAATESANGALGDLARAAQETGASEAEG